MMCNPTTTSHKNTNKSPTMISTQLTTSDTVDDLSNLLPPPTSVVATQQEGGEVEDDNDNQSSNNDSDVAAGDDEGDGCKVTGVKMTRTKNKTTTRMEPTMYKYRDFGSLTEQEIEAITSDKYHSSGGADQDESRSTSPTPNSSPKLSSISSASSIRGQKFPVKLYAILSREEFHDIITWMPHGRSWKVLKPNLFESLIMPLFFEYRNYHSFNRLINAWSFRRISESGPDRGSYYHELFLRGKPQLHKFMRRLPKTHKKLPMKREDEPDFYKLNQTSPLPQLNEKEEQVYWSSNNEYNGGGGGPTATDLDDTNVQLTKQMKEDQQHNLMMKTASSIAGNGLRPYDDAVVVGGTIPTKLRSLGGGFGDEQPPGLFSHHQSPSSMIPPILGGGGMIDNGPYGALPPRHHPMMPDSDRMAMMKSGMRTTYRLPPQPSMSNGFMNHMMANSCLQPSSSSQFGMSQIYQQQQMQQSLPCNYTTMMGGGCGNPSVMMGQLPSSSSNMMMTMIDPYEQQQQLQFQRQQQQQQHLQQQLPYMEPPTSMMMPPYQQHEYHQITNSTYSNGMTNMTNAYYDDSSLSTSLPSTMMSLGHHTNMMPPSMGTYI